MDDQHRIHAPDVEDITEEYQFHDAQPGYFRILLWGLVVWAVLYCAWFFLSGWNIFAT